MTICIDEVIELLRAELGNADPVERRQIESDPLCNGVADLRHQRRMSHYDNRSKPDALYQACCFGSSSLKPLRKSFTIIQPARKRSGASSASICWTVSRSISIRMNIASTAATESPR
ncbi:hypothetical protein [Rhizobium leguminosarum]|uniref:hypothetical protein n=1 Tax=Rhizobium leguminosarum TaxID=384 RepID=UPI0012BD2218|nr:hypothetical protein [Rhizobium leguminosarum]